MKNNAFKLVGLALIVPMMTACPKGTKEGPNWSQELQDAMKVYVGEVLPYVELDKETLSYGYDDTYAALGVFEFIISDENENDVFEGYADKLVEAGFEYTEFEYDGGVIISYDKTNDVGLVSVDFYWQAASETTPAGNFINVAIPEYIDEDLLIEYGYEKQQGWPTELLEEVMDGSGLTVPAVNAEGEWFVASELAHNDAYGDWYNAYLVSKGDFVEEFGNALLDAGCGYDEDYECFYDPTYVSDYEIYASVSRGFTMLTICGPTLAPEVASEEEQADGSIDVSFTFAGALTDGDAFNNAGFESTSASVEFSQGGNGSNAPKYYDNGQAIRCYAKNTVTISAASGLTINSVTIEVGFLKTLKPADIGVSSGTVSASATSAPATVTISGVNASTLTITVGPSASSGNIGFSSIKVNVSSAQ